MCGKQDEEKHCIALSVAQPVFGSALVCSGLVWSIGLSVSLEWGCRCCERYEECCIVLPVAGSVDTNVTHFSKKYTHSRTALLDAATT